MGTRWALGIRVLSLTAVIGAFLVFLGTAAGGPQPAALAGPPQPGHAVGDMPRVQLRSTHPSLGSLALSRSGAWPLPKGTTLVPRRVLVRFRSSITARARAHAASAVKASVQTVYHLVPGLELLRLPAGSSMERAVAALSRDPRVQYAVPDLAVKLAAMPDDPLYYGQWAPAVIGAPAAWDRTTGSASVTVAVLDTGAVLNHPDLAANLVPGWDFVNNTGTPADDYGHGTHVAGIIGAVGDNGTGVSGVNWHVSLMPLKICNAGGSCSLDLEVSALQYAVAHGAKIANASFGGYYGGSQPEEDAISAAGQAGVLFVAAAGNSSFNSNVVPFYPASYPLDNIISVAATDSSGALASFSNFGFKGAEIGAPGEDILSTMLTSGPLSDSTGYGTLSGTSMAAPEVSGAAALLWAEHPGWTMQQVRTRLLTTASPLASLSGEVSDCGQLNVGAATDPAVADHGIVCVHLSGTGAGSVTSDVGGITCGTTCVASLPAGAMVTLSATPSAGSAFAGWSGACTGMGTCPVTASGVAAVTAVFSASGSAPGWQGKRIHAPIGRDIFTPGSVFIPGGPTCFDCATFYNVAVSADGIERADAVYNPTGDCYLNTPDNGAVFLERRTTAGWVSDGAVRPPNLAYKSGDQEASWTNCANFGAVTQLSADGTTLLVSPNMQPVYDTSVPGSFRYRCAAFVYQRGVNGWALDTVLYPPGIGAQGSLTADGCDYFGIQGAISDDGTRVAMFATGPNGSGGYENKVDVYARSAGVWGLEQQLHVPTPTAHCAAGVGERSLSLSGDGATLLVGDFFCDDTGGTFESGLAFAYARSGTQWTLTQTLNAPTPAFQKYFGAVTSLSQDGNTAVVTNWVGDTAWVYERDAGGWHFRAQLPVSGLPVECLKVVEDGARIICAAMNQDVGSNLNQGALFVVDRPAGGWASGTAQVKELFATDGLDWERLGVANPDDWSTVAAPEDGSFAEAPIQPTRFVSGAYPHDRVGYDFTTGLVDKTLSVHVASGGSGSIRSNLTGIDCGAICSHDYADSTSVTLTATPAAGSTFGGWTGACSGSGQCTLTMNADHTVSATFLPPKQLSVSKTGSGSGSITSSPAGISCGSTCSHSFGYGTSVHLTATPATGSSFAGWTGGCSGTGSCTVSMIQARSVTAAFKFIPENLKVARAGAAAGAGTVTSSPAGISCGATCLHAFNYGTSVTLIAHASSGSMFTGWSGACTGTASTCHVSMTAARAVTATFAVTKVLTFIKGGTGSGKVTSSPAGISCTASCAHAFAAGTVVTLTASAKAGSHFAGWTGACSGTGKCVVTMSAAKSVKAFFNAGAAAPRRTGSRLQRRLAHVLGRLVVLPLRLASRA
jgi:subtilisin family serine protease